MTDPGNPPMDQVTAPWWEATRKGRFLVQRCEACGHHQHYPRALCAVCAATNLDFVEASGQGRVYSFTVVYRAPGPAFDPPYVVALVRLNEGPLVLTNIIDAEVNAIRCEQMVALAWRPLPDGRQLPVFVPAHEGQGGDIRGL